MLFLSLLSWHLFSSSLFTCKRLEKLLAVDCIYFFGDINLSEFTTLPTKRGGTLYIDD